MKKILIRNGINPLEVPNISDIINRNLIGDNIGNLIYNYSIYRGLMTSDQIEYIPDCYTPKLRDVDWYNENCSMYVLPMADMFRDNGINYMERMAEFISRLTIPCVIIGVGMKADIGVDPGQNFSFDPAVKKLMSAVLDKSAMVGLRGERTARYLEHLGFKEDRHFKVIGCPSMYTFGDTLPQKELKLTPESRISINENIIAPDHLNIFLENVVKEYPDYSYIPQRREELWMIYTGRPYTAPMNPPHFQKKLTDPMYQEDRVKCFLHVPSWIQYLKDMDLSLGCRLHGNIAGIMAGIPSILFVHDARMMELCNYHKLPHVLASDIREDMQLADLLEMVDFDSMHKVQKANFDNYVSFLDANGLDHIYKHPGMNEDSPFDRAVEKVGYIEPIPSVIHLDAQDLSKRWMGIYQSAVDKGKADKAYEIDYYRGVVARKNEALHKKTEQFKELKQRYNKLNETTIKTDVSMLTRKLGAKLRGNVGDNFSRIGK